ncbi:hypothetical protein SAMN03159390_00613 [Pseudomonas sp. NFACC49-2]|uniref:hypothetical protein n=1 Tax=Pseudomonas sp. NFACC49-2 TaxID=1566222 RepID=UPI000918944C|nr:hypothetical protein [Pseudomonas sp. NFACC49-2]SFX17116.1 hypothetical protein SAMN03159390_00613 [Pseudomonas sp. NFACC49-2]
MTMDKQKLQKLLWSEVASWKADCGEWKQNAEALGEFLGEKTVEEVALELLAENDNLRRGNETWRLSIEAERNGHNVTVRGLQDELERLRGPAFAEELAALRKDAERYRWLRAENVAGSNIQVSEWIGPHEYQLYTAELDAAIDAAMGQGVQP